MNFFSLLIIKKKKKKKRITEQLVRSLGVDIFLDGFAVEALFNWRHLGTLSLKGSKIDEHESWHISISFCFKNLEDSIVWTFTGVYFLIQMWVES